MTDQEKNISGTRSERLPLDAKLLAEAVIELNISRRSVGIYPADHPIVRESIDRAFQKLEQLFEIRNEITLGIAAESLVIDEYTLDRKNPVFSEFAQSLHAKGIASVAFISGLAREELVSLHEILSLKELPPEQTVSTLAAGKGIRRIALSMIDFSQFTFFENAKRGGDQGRIWEDYIHGFLEGTLGGEGDDGIFLAAPEDVAAGINKVMPEGMPAESYDRIITAYIQKKNQSRLSSDTLNKFFRFVQSLRPELKRQFLSRSFVHMETDIAGVERSLAEMSEVEFGKIVEMITSHTSLIPETLKNLIDKLASIKQSDRQIFDFFYQKSAVLDDIEIGDDMLKLFGDDHFHAYVSDEYRRELEKMLMSITGESARYDKLREGCREEVIDRAHLDILLELLEADNVTADDYLTLVTKLTELVSSFLETGRFEEVLEVYNALKSHTLMQRFSEAASSAIAYYFHTPETIGRVLEAIRIWGRKDRDATARLVKALRQQIMEPLLDLLAEENDAVLRKFYLSVLAILGSDLHAHILGRLGDTRWYVVRNMLYLVRECNCKPAIDQVRRIAKHDNPHLCIEAVRTLLYFRTNDAVPFLRAFLNHEQPEIRNRAVRLAGASQEREVVPVLIEMLETRDLLGTETIMKADVVRSLASIGDPRAIPALMKLCRSHTLFNRHHFENLKVEIFRDLDGYPPEKVQPLLEMGLSSKNAMIRELSGHYHARSRKGGDA